MTKTLPRFVFVTAVLLVLPACSGIIELPGQGPAPQTYSLTPVEIVPDVQSNKDWRLLVEEPDASRAIDSDRIAIKLSPVEISYYLGARWSDRAPRLIQSLLIESLDNAGILEHVGRTSSGINAQYMIKSNLLAFQAEIDAGDPRVVVKLKLTLVERAKARIIGSRTFEGRTQPAGRQTRDVVLAFNEASAEALRGSVTWIVSTIDADELSGSAGT